MNTPRHLHKEQWEEEAIDRFIVFLKQDRGIIYAITGRDVRPSASSNKDFDYQLQDTSGTKIAVEIFRLVEDGKDLARDRTWGKIVQLLKQELLKRNVKGYLISTPYFSVKKKDMEVFSSRLAEQLEAAIKGNEDKRTFEYGDFEFRKIDNFDTVAFSYAAGARAIDPTGTAFNSFTEKLPTKNKQVAASDHERILLVLNWAVFVDVGDAVRALTKLDFQQFENIDKIFFEARPGEIHLVFDRSVSDSINQVTSLRETGSISPLLLEKLRYRLGDKDPVAFDFVKRNTTELETISWLGDNGAKENLIHLGTALLSKGSIDDAMWIIRQLKNDPDPDPNGANGPNDPEGKFNHHVDALNDRDVRIITTVRGHLCWLIMQVIGQNKPELYAELIEIIKQYIFEDNLYIRVQCTYPLFELVRRRKAIRNQDGSPFAWDAAERELVVGLAFEMLRANAKHSRVLEALLQVFNNLRDVNEKEAEEVLSTFITPGKDYLLHDIAALVIYFALFRTREFPEKGSFNPYRFTSLLKDQIVNGKPSMRSSLAWHFWKILQEDALPYHDVRDYVSLFWANGYESSVASMFGLVFEELAKKSPEDAITLFEESLKLLKDEIAKHPSELHNFWVNGVEHVIPVLGPLPARLLNVVGTLRDLWIAGCPFIGDIQTIFESYVFAPSLLRDTTKTKLRAIYEEMKIHQPRLPAVNWDR